MNIKLLFLVLAILVQNSSQTWPNLANNIEERGLDDNSTKPLPSWAVKYTMNQTGCACWFDLSMNATDCACCKNNGTQCGYPMHQFCQMRKPGQKQFGCPGVPNSKYTLSTRGHPCLPNGDRTGCAWCVLGAKQCNQINSPGHQLIRRSLRSAGGGGYSAGSLADHTKWINDTWTGSICVNIRDYSQCIGTPTSCDVSPDMCGANAHCDMTYTKVLSDEFHWKVGQCRCDTGFIGNGFQCANNSTGVVSRKVAGDGKIQLDLMLTKDIYNVPIGTLRKGNVEDNFFDELEKIHNSDNGTDVCQGGCQADVVFCGEREETCEEVETTTEMTTEDPTTTA